MGRWIGGKLDKWEGRNVDFYFLELVAQGVPI